MTDRLDTRVLGFWSSIKVKSDLRCFEKIIKYVSKILQKMPFKPENYFSEESSFFRFWSLLKKPKKNRNFEAI